MPDNLELAWRQPSAADAPRSPNLALGGMSTEALLTPTIAMPRSARTREGRETAIPLRSFAGLDGGETMGLDTSAESDGRIASHNREEEAKVGNRGEGGGRVIEADMGEEVEGEVAEGFEDIAELVGFVTGSGSEEAQEGGGGPEWEEEEQVLGTFQDAPIANATTAIAESAEGNRSEEGGRDKREPSSGKRVFHFDPEPYWRAGVWGPGPDELSVAYDSDSDSSSDATIRPFQRRD